MNFDSGVLFLLRPQWLWALLALPLLAWAWQRGRRRGNAWRQAVDPHLLPALLEAGPSRATWPGLLLAALAYALAVVALAGPGWRDAPQPLWQSRAPLVVALDLSSTMLAPDLPPTRLAQARAKLATLLEQRRGGQVGLVAFADEPYTVAPLTDDAHNVALFLDALAPEVMPVDGQRADRAIDWAAQLMQRTGFTRGDILLVTDHADAAARTAAAGAHRQDYRVSVLGVGTAEGAGVRLARGALGHARLDAGSLQSLARAGGGAYAALSAGPEDLARLGVLDSAAADAERAGAGGGRARRDEGYWLLPLLMLLVLPAFRRRGAIAVLAAVCLLPGQVRAADWWMRPDQQAHRRMEQAAEAYRKDRFDRAAALYGTVDTADAHYDRGNALAKAGKYPQAVAAYDRALRLRPGMPDAVANRSAVLAAMRQRPPQGPGSKGGQGQQRSSGQKGQPGQEGQPGQAPPSGGRDGEVRDRRAGARQPPPAGASGTPPPQADPASAATQQAADAAQRARMERALQQQGRSDDRSATRAGKAPSETPAQRERRLANEAWLRRVPDDPGGLLRAKFQLEYERRHGTRPPED